MYDYEIQFDKTKKQIETLVDNVGNKEELKRELISMLNENLHLIEQMALKKVQDLKTE